MRNCIQGVDQLLHRAAASVNGLVQLAPGRLDAELFQLVAPGIGVDGGVSSLPLRAVGRTAPGRVTVTFVLDCPGPGVMDGCTVRDGAVLAWRPGDSYHGISPGGFRWVTVSVPEDRLDGVESLLRASDPSRLPLRHARMTAAVRTQVLGLLDEMDVRGGPGGRAVEHTAAASLRSRWTALLRWALRHAEPLAPERRGLASAAATVLAVEGWFLAHLADDVYLEDAAAAAAVPPRSVEHAFRVLLGMPPMRYLEILRAHALFLALRRGGEDAALRVADAAARVGVRHVARFAARYRALFQEGPVETLRAARRAAKTRPRG